MAERPRLHSAYDPRREALRFIEAQEALRRAHPSCILLLGAGEGHVFKAIKERFPDIPVIRIFYDPEPASQAEGAEPFWYPGTSETVEGFLSRHIHDTLVPGLVVLEWPPSARIWPETSRTTRDLVAQFVRERTGTILTSLHSGRRWLRNLVRNTLIFDTYYLPDTPPPEILVAASGPSLTTLLPSLTRTPYHLWALPSSLAALSAHRIRPHAAVATDGSPYARLHLSHLPPDTPLFAPLTAALTPHARLIPLSLHSPLEQALLSLLPLPHIRLGPHGTVAGTALLLALSLGATRILTAGLDLAILPPWQHVRPHTFDPLIETAATRTTPLLHLRHTPILLHTRPIPGTPWHTTESLTTYAGWFASHPPSPSHTLIRINPSPTLPTLENHPHPPRTHHHPPPTPPHPPPRPTTPHPQTSPRRPPPPPRRTHPPRP